MHSLSKEKINFVLLEGIHERAADHIRQAGYSSLSTRSGALDDEALIEAIEDAHFLGIRSRTHLSDELLDRAKRLTAIGCFCIGTDQVDLDAARKRGIPVFNAPYANTRSVAELVLAEIIMLMRGIPAKHMAAQRGQWLKTATGSHEVRGKVLGIVGYGHIGSQLGILAEGLGMKVIYHDIVDKLPLGNAEPVESLNVLLDAAQVVSLHVPDTELTRGLIDARALKTMRAGSHLINASRGKVVDIPALAEALRSGHIAGAALDVFPVEPSSAGEEFRSELRGMDNVLLTPHIGGSTHEAQENIALDVAAKLVRYSDNGSTMGAVNFPEVTLPDHVGARRIMHIHRNEPGVLQAINAIFSAAGINIVSQYLQTLPDIGYVVMDVEAPDTPALVAELDRVPATIRTRYLY
ncbi:phosphoglycerate dehydrogenase [Wenzhouxiangella marina]|uniref:D-3-phosphoglycerate dehydrogenase n=1 Tax=Wenzhouxiangella marina TaxID=1579979 RepID=A0A0K0XWQ4_9GAMM|nr:phosphoglycerate dehydrogenase [Wenzhouxiangella marina]AKS42062.1 3-phosphoglycerate dehydrogenase [Wenzhouxiangella marina]MBB6086169.1 D-3-phosphoglycerate dehydrogenase [Wenzhouxiangella marina]